LFWAAQNGHAEAMKLLIAAGANPASSLPTAPIW
jgi:ankyrin repeat protein